MTIPLHAPSPLPTPTTGRTPDMPPRTSPTPGLAAGPLPWIALIGGVIVQFADVMLAKAILDVVLNISETVSWTLAVCISFAADLAAMWAGYARAAGKKADMWISLAVWLVIGMSVTLVRWFGAALTADPEANPATDRVLAFVMLALYCAAGAACIHASEVIFAPARVSYHAANRTIRNRRHCLQKLEPAYTRIDTTLTTAREQRRIYEKQRADEAHATAESLEALLKDHARQQILAHLSSPVAAPLIRAPHKPSSGTAPVAEEAAA